MNYFRFPMKMISCRDWDENKHEIFENEITFRPSVYGLFLRSGEILLSPQRDGYDFPGGGMEIGETIEQTLVREFYEETGLCVSVKDLIYCGQDFYYSIPHKKAFNTILLYYTCTYKSGEISTDGFDKYEKGYARKAEWVSIDQIKKIKFHNPVDSVAVIHKAMTI